MTKILEEISDIRQEPFCERIMELIIDLALPHVMKEIAEVVVVVLVPQILEQFFFLIFPNRFRRRGCQNASWSRSSTYLVRKSVRKRYDIVGQVSSRQHLLRSHLENFNNMFVALWCQHFHVLFHGTLSKALLRDPPRSPKVPVVKTTVSSSLHLLTSSEFACSCRRGNSPSCSVTVTWSNS